MTAAPAEFYDARLAEPGTALLMDPAESPYRELWAEVLSLIPAGQRVVELGCGTGRFAGLLLAHGVESYVGLDFAPGHIAEARRHLPDADFRLVDIRVDEIPDADLYVALEVLEHLDDDRAVLERLPSRATVVLSVPSFDSASHVRMFPAQGDARERYRRQLRIDVVRYVTRPNGAFFHLLRGERP